MDRRRKDRVALLSAPWPLYNRPSIQLGALKGYLRKSLPDVTIDAYHLYLPVAAEIGYSRYAALSERTWMAEPVFAARLFPSRADAASSLFYREAHRQAPAVDFNFKRLVKRAGDTVDRFIAGVDWEAYLAVGITISLCQLTASLYLAREIKRRRPDLHIVAGGSSVAGPSGRAINDTFEWIDTVVQGEGEKPLTTLVRRLQRGSVQGACHAHFDQLASLEDLPAPDYDDYFVQLEKLPAAKRFFPVLPAEMSRGCWWQKKLGNGGRGCAFCNLNTQWRGYRSKSPDRIVSEISTLKNRHQLVSFAFMDNALPVKKARAALAILAGAGHDFSFFGEIRASTDFNSLLSMRRAGLARVQIGIESLSNRLLQKLNKGTTTIENLEIMKHCEELGIENRSNLIVQFPGSDEKDVAQTLRAIEFAAVYRPLKPVRFWLGLGSPVCSDFTAFGIQTHFNHHHYRALFPRDICRAVPLVIQAYRGDRGRQEKLWRPVIRRVKQWENAYAAVKTRFPGVPLLGYRDGGDFIIIRGNTPAGRAHRHRLTGSSREIYLYCRRRRAFSDIAGRYKGFSEGQIKGFLGDMVRKKLMFTESGQYLSLAVRMR